MPKNEDDFLRRQFEYERCSNCGGDTSDHTVTYGPAGEPHAVCKSEI